MADIFNSVTRVTEGTDNITAAAGGGQANATKLTGRINRVTTVATTGDSVVLLSAAPGLDQVVRNDGANSLNVFPSLADAINALGLNNAFALAAGKTAVFYASSVIQWSGVLTA